MQDTGDDDDDDTVFYNVVEESSDKFEEEFEVTSYVAKKTSSSSLNEGHNQEKMSQTNGATATSETEQGREVFTEEGGDRQTQTTGRASGCFASIRAFWTFLSEGILHKWMRKFVVTLGTNAARHPIPCIGSIIFLSFALVAIGFFTNFRTEFEQRRFLTPTSSLPHLHSQWIQDEFETLRYFWMTLHSDGDNALTPTGIRQALETIDTVRTAPAFKTVCSQSKYLSFSTNKPTCQMFTVTQFWNHNITLFEEKIAAADDNEEDYGKFNSGVLLFAVNRSQLVPLM